MIQIIVSNFKVQNYIILEAFSFQKLRSIPGVFNISMGLGGLNKIELILSTESFLGFWLGI